MAAWILPALGALAVLVACAVIPRLWSFLRLKYFLRALPTPEPSHFLLGHVKYLRDRTKVRERRQRWRSRCPKLYKYALGFLFDIVQICHADTAAAVLRSSAPKHEYTYAFLRPWLGNGLLISNGRKWARDRRMLTHCFHFDILRSYVEVYTDACSVMLQKWSEACESGESVDVSKSSTLLTLDVILRCAMGFESNCQLEGTVDDSASRNHATQYAATVIRLSHSVLQRMLKITSHSDLVYYNSAEGKALLKDLECVHSISQKLIESRRTALDTDGGTRPSQGRAKHRDFLDVLLTVKDEEGNGLTNEEIREQVDTFLFRGHDTTASALQWIIYHLSEHEEYQEKCRQEVQAILPPGGEQLNHSHLQQMSYVTQFIKESMRLSSPVPLMSRELTEDTEMEGYMLPRGVSVELSTLDVHTHPEHWPDPERFDPDRFSPERSANRHPFAYIPFSAGQRNCIGQALAMDELKASVALILYKFKLTPDPKAPRPIWTSALVARAIPGISVNLQLT